MGLCWDEDVCIGRFGVAGLIQAWVYEVGVLVLPRRFAVGCGMWHSVDTGVFACSRNE